MADLPARPGPWPATEHVPEEALGEPCRALLAHARGLGGPPVPKAALRPENIPPALLPHLCMLDVLPGGGFRFRLFGTALAGGYGRDLTGRLLAEAETGEPGAEVHRLYARVARTGAPALTRTAFPTPAGPISYERVVLPLCDGDGAVRWLLALIAVLDAPRHKTVLAAVGR